MSNFSSLKDIVSDLFRPLPEKNNIQDRESRKFDGVSLCTPTDCFCIVNKTAWTFVCYDDAEAWNSLEKTFEVLKSIRDQYPNDVMEVVRVKKMVLKSL